MEITVRLMISSLSVMLYTTCSFLIINTSTAAISFKAGSNETDRLALLAFKSKITQDPLGILSSWNDYLPFCEWKGITCGRGHRNRVTALELQSQMLVGTISPHIGNLTFLQELDLKNNSFSGEIPQQISHLYRLKGLNLLNNSLGGEIPINISHCINLVSLDLYNNKLLGRIPAELGSLSKLKRLLLNRNDFFGSIPSSLGNLSSLNFLYLNKNHLEGNIPSDLGKLTSLTNIHLGFNNLSGMIPPSLYNLSLLRVFTMSSNQLQGTLPFDVGYTLPNLREFTVFMNNFTGTIPTSFSNCSGLEDLQMSNNHFHGSVPNNIGNLQSLYVLGLHHNNLGSGRNDEAVDDLRFITSLTNCSNLVLLMFNDNEFRGTLPSSIGNVSTKMTNLILGRNQIHGSIPEGIQNLVGLDRLGMEYNMLTGSIPIGIGKLQNLRGIALHGNRLTGMIPSSLGNLTQLSELYLGSNQLSGRIPSSLGNYKYLISLDLSQNKLNGTIPAQVIGLSPLSIFLDLSSNSLSGSLPLEVGNLRNLGVLVLSENRLSGEIPSSLSECLSLRRLSMEGNFFQGNIPPSLSSLKGIEDLSLSHNNLSGLIPKELEKLNVLSMLNLSFNNLEGEVPSRGAFKNSSRISVFGNSKLCGGVPQLHLPKCPIKDSKKPRKKSHSLKVIVLIAVGTILLVLILSSFLILYWRKESKKKLSSTVNSGNRFLEIVSYNELLKATNGFSSSNLLGVGSFGSVYKAILQEDEKPVAVKVLNLQQRGANKSFMAECGALREVRHRNLLKIITSCSSTDFQGNDFKALVFEFMANGSLENWLHPSNDFEEQPSHRNLSFRQRLNIAIDVASALEYLHHHCETTLVHRDLKPSNVLLDEDLVAHVGDFGLAKFLLKSSSYNGQNEQTTSAAVKGSIGYVAPEYGMGSEVSTRGDVYSYGILLLEMFTGKRPTDDLFKDGLSLHNFSEMALLSDQILGIADSCLLLVVDDDDDEPFHGVEHGRDIIKECLASIVQIGVVCSAELSADRMNMDKVVQELNIVKDLFLGIGRHGVEESVQISEITSKYP